MQEHKWSFPFLVCGSQAWFGRAFAVCFFGAKYISRINIGSWKEVNFHVYLVSVSFTHLMIKFTSWIVWNVSQALHVDSVGYFSVWYRLWKNLLTTLNHLLMFYSTKLMNVPRYKHLCISTLLSFVFQICSPGYCIWSWCSWSSQHIACSSNEAGFWMALPDKSHVHSYRDSTLKQGNGN
jgi:hypothetical protein